MNGDTIEVAVFVQNDVLNDGGLFSQKSSDIGYFVLRDSLRRVNSAIMGFFHPATLFLFFAPYQFLGDGLSSEI